MFDLKLFRKQLEESRNIHECELPPLPEVEEGETVFVHQLFPSGL